MALKKVTRGVGTSFWFATLVCFFGSAFYFYDFFLQALPGVISFDLIRDLKISSFALGGLSSAYFLTYTPMQLVAGLMYDRYGPRILLGIMIAVCAIGAINFGLSTSVWMLVLGRILMGFASAFAFICALGLISRWFDKRLFSTLTGIVMSMSSVGAISAAIPLVSLVLHFGWRKTTIYVGFAGLILSVLVFLIVKDEPKYSKKSKSFINSKNNIMTPYKNQLNKELISEEFKRLKKVLKDKYTWIIGLYAFFMWAPMTIFTELWGIPYLSKVANLSYAQSNACIAIIWVSVGIFSPVIGLFSEICGKRLLPLRITAIIGFFSIIFILIFPHMPKPLLSLSLFCFGIAPTGAILSFAVVKDINKSNLGAAIGFNNMMIVLGGLIFQPLVGVFLDILGTSNPRNTLYNSYGEKLPIDLSFAYQISLIIIPICFLLGFIISLFFIKETHGNEYL